MKTKLFLLFAVSSFLLFTSCKKDGSKFQVTFTNNVTQGTADANGEYTLTGHISSRISLQKVTLTKQGDSGPFLVDESTAKNKNEYDFSYLVTGITSNTTIIMHIFDQGGGITSAEFLVMK